MITDREIDVTQWIVPLIKVAGYPARRLQEKITAPLLIVLRDVPSQVKVERIEVGAFINIAYVQFPAGADSVFHFGFSSGSPCGKRRAKMLARLIR